MAHVVDDIVWPGPDMENLWGEAKLSLHADLPGVPKVLKGEVSVLLHV